MIGFVLIMAGLGLVASFIGVFLGWSQRTLSTLLMGSLLLILLRALWELPHQLVWLWMLVTIGLAAGFYVRTRR